PGPRLSHAFTFSMAQRLKLAEGSKMHRRTFLTGIGAVASVKGGSQPLVSPKSTSHMPPRKVIVGTMMQSFWGEHPGLEKRLDQLAVIIDRMSEESKRQYGRDLDLAI